MNLRKRADLAIMPKTAAENGLQLVFFLRPVHSDIFRARSTSADRAKISKRKTLLRIISRRSIIQECCWGREALSALAAGERERLFLRANLFVARKAQVNSPARRPLCANRLPSTVPLVSDPAPSSSACRDHVIALQGS